MDFMTPEQRHKNMCNIKQKNTSPERMLMKELRKYVWFFHHCADLPGKPDIVFKRKRVAVFVDSDFWHGRAALPKSNVEFWSKKFEYNLNHDMKVNKTLEEAGWKVLRFSDRQIKKELESCVKTVLCAIGRDDCGEQ